MNELQVLGLPFVLEVAREYRPFPDREGGGHRVGEPPEALTEIGARGESRELDIQTGGRRVDEMTRRFPRPAPPARIHPADAAPRPPGHRALPPPPDRHPAGGAVGGAKGGGATDG